jgi:hypothetical protein
LRGDLEHGRVHLPQRIDALLELDVVGRKLGLSRHRVCQRMLQ